MAFQAPLGKDEAEWLPRGVSRIQGGGSLLFEKMLLETIKAESSLYLSESKQQSKALRKQLTSVQDYRGSQY